MWFTDLSQSFPIHALREKILILCEQQVIGHCYGTTLACHQHRRSSAVQGLSVDFGPRIAARQGCARQIHEVLAVRQKLNPHVAGLSGKEGGHRLSSAAVFRHSEDRTVHCLGEQDRPIGTPSSLRNFWSAADHFWDCARWPNLLQLGTRPEADKL